MASNPLSKLKRRLSAAIDWRVRQSFEAERELMMGIDEAVTELNVIYADKLSALLMSNTVMSTSSRFT